MAAKKPSAPERAQLRKEFVSLLHREQRLGLRDDCRPELDAAWDAFLEKVLGK